MLEKQGSLRMILPVLPTYYYLDHFTEMMSFVEETYGAALGPEHYGFMEQFRGLAMDEQCLCVRMLNRGGDSDIEQSAFLLDAKPCAVI
jgi:DNA polymerase III subunit epsilon